MSFIIRIIFVALISLGIQFYFVRRLSSSIKKVFPQLSERKLKNYRIVLLFYANLYLIIGLFYLLASQLSDRQIIFPPQYPLFDYLIQFPFWVYIVIVLQSTLLFLPVDIISFFLAKIKINYKEKIVSAASRIRFFTFIFFLLYVPIRMYYDYSTVSTRIVEYKKPGLPDELEGFRIVFIADVQADRYTNKERLNKYIAESNKTNPDLVLIAGDVITSTPAYIKVAAEALGNIKSKYGVYSCVGDHDNWAYRNDTERSIREISDALFQYNVKMIDNGKLIINAGGSSIGITFITNTYVKRIDQNTIDSLTNNSGAEDLKIFLTHQPRQFLIDYAVNSNYDLFLAGHTHGGQLTFFFPFFNLSPTLIETKYVRGNFHFGSMLAVVNRGLGMSLAPIRYNSTPEVTLIILKSI